MKKKKGFTLGRFQPFHNEHAGLIEDMKRDCDVVYVGILETDLSAQNPFTYDERKDMILGYDDSLEVFSYEKKDMLALGIGIRQNVPMSATYYSGNMKERIGMGILGFQSKGRKRMEDVSATKVRSLIEDDDNEWIRLVPKSTKKIVKKIKNKRLKKISNLGKKHRVLKKYDI